MIVKDKTERGETVHARARMVLARASVIAEAPAMRIETDKTAHAKPGTITPRSTGESLFDQISRAIRHASHEEALFRVVVEAERLVADFTRTPAPPKELLVTGSLPWKRHIAGLVVQADTGARVKEIARVWGCSRASAYNYAKQYGVDRADA